eukprot:CAMPEP_0196822430 /NCGR_PEP_ID=MMETSP1362-20130617/83466_1 /TAXON_ID=163516 /ORGANISM="Leptocylindrus danicus, Strain CCMP1856" /LENGTH=245 /DNA_ID=CAMNT_0042201987 /DNA_START=424 /DNA_END=1161 /DNA_ORIENTATION=-
MTLMYTLSSSSRICTTASWIGHHGVKRNVSGPPSAAVRRVFLTTNANVRYHGTTTTSSIRRFAASSSSSGNATEVAAPKKRDPRTLGSAKVPFTWNQLRSIVENDQLDKMSRSASEQKRYEEYTAVIKTQWVSVVDNILYSKFGFEREQTMVDHQSLFRAVPSLSEVTSVYTSLVPNDFPYYVEEGIEHWCLWKLCEDVSPSDIIAAKKELYETRNAEEFIHWVNPPHLKSIPQIDHAHILIRTE